MRNTGTPSNRDAVARKRRRDLIQWQHLIRQTAVAEMTLKRHREAGADVATIAAASAALAVARRAAGLRDVA